MGRPYDGISPFLFFTACYQKVQRDIPKTKGANAFLAMAKSEQARFFLALTWVVLYGGKLNAPEGPSSLERCFQQHPHITAMMLPQLLKRADRWAKVPADYQCGMLGISPNDQELSDRHRRGASDARKAWNKWAQDFVQDFARDAQTF